MSVRGIKPIPRVPSAPPISWQRRAYLLYIKGIITASELVRAITARRP